MADIKITDLPEIPTVDGDDILLMVDVSDETAGPNGTDKRATVGQVKELLGVVQTTGSSTTDIMSQKAVSDELDAKLDTEYMTLKIFQSPTDGGLTEIQTRTVDANEVYEVRKTSDNSLATIYSDAAGTAEIVQNGTSNVSDSGGVVEFYTADGNYYVDVGGESNNFSVDVLRQDLANPDKGATMVARGVVAVDSIADLLALSEGQRKGDLRYLVKGYHAGSAVGGGEFYWDQSRTTENNDGTVIDGFVRVSNSVTLESFGCVGDDTTDNGDKIEKLNEFLANSPIKVTAGKGVFITSVPFKPTTGFSGSGKDATFIKWISNGVSAAGVVIPSGSGIYCDFTADGGVSDDPTDWDNSNYDSFTGVRGVRVRSDFVVLINVRGQNTRMAGIASYGFKNTRLENCETIRSRGNFGDGFYFSEVEQVSFINCKAYDFTRIGFVGEGKEESPSIGIVYENCVAEYGHDGSNLYGGGEFNAGFWNENCTNVYHISCKTINSGSRGFTTAFATGSSFLKAPGVVSYTSCTAMNREGVLGTSEIGIGFSLSALNSPYRGRVTLTNCSTIRIDRGFGSSSGVDSILLGCSYTNSGGGVQSRPISASTNASTVIKNFQELWSNRPTDITDSGSNVASIGSYSGDSESARLISVDDYTTLDGVPCVVKNRISSYGTPLRLEFKNTNVAPIGTCYVRGGFVLEGGSLMSLNGSNSLVTPLDFTVSGANVELEGGLLVSWSDSTRRISMTNCSISKKDNGRLTIYRSSGTQNINIRVVFSDCAFRWNLEEDGYIVQQNSGSAYSGSAGQNHLYSNCTFVNTGGSTVNEPIRVETTTKSAGRMYFTGCWKSPTIGDMTKAGFTQTGSVIEDL